MKNKMPAAHAFRHAPSATKGFDIIKTFRVVARLFIVFLALWSLSSLETYAVAQAGSQDKEQECTTLLRHRAEALGEKDYTRLETMAKQFLQDCKALYSSEEYSMAYLDVAIAHMQREDFAAALDASQRCIDVFYENAFCHVYKTWALIEIKKTEEARTESDIAEKLIDYLLEKNERESGAATEQRDKEAYAVNEKNLKASKRLLEALRTKLHQPSSDQFKI
jgi:hypothetical protein